MKNNCIIHITAADNFPTIIFTEESMAKLLTAYKSLLDLEKLLSMIAGIDPTSGLLNNLRHMDNLIQDLSPLYDSKRDYDEQVYTTILKNDSLSIPEKAHILLGSRKENGISGIESELSAYELLVKGNTMLDEAMQRSSVFTVENMADLLMAYYGYFNLAEAIDLFIGNFPGHKILFGLSHLADLLCNLSPLYHLEYDDDENENEQFTTVLKSNDIGLWDKARLLIGSEL